MTRNIIKNLLLAATLAATLGAGTLSARQLRSQPQRNSCGGFTCGFFSPNGPFRGCPFPSCVCVLPDDGTTIGFCSGSLPGLGRSSKTPGK
ncbi:MAG TPA: hypothetical protein VFB76_15040 [Candidatus Angelobacter sp.]|nr:hypothetical protein [Candidatus Angelobacter sp.]